MKKRQAAKRIICTVCSIVFLLCFGAPVLASSSIPQAVTEARNGIVQVEARRNAERATMGLGFAIVANRNVYIIANPQTTYFTGYKKEGITYRIYYAKDAYVDAELIEESRDLGISILKPSDKIPGIVPLTLQTKYVDVGTDVYLYEALSENKNILSFDIDSFGVSKSTIQGTREAALTDPTLGLVQYWKTDAVIFIRSIGSPLLDSKGNVVGVSVMETSSKSATCLHIQELLHYIENAGIAYSNQSANGVTNSETDNVTDGSTYVLWIAVSIIFIAIIVLGITLGSKAAKNKKSKAGTPVLSIIDSGQPLDEQMVCDAGKTLLQSLFANRDSILQGAAPLVAENVWCQNNGALEYKLPKTKKKAVNPQAQTEEAVVYFAGAILYALRTGEMPPSAVSRAGGEALLLGTGEVDVIIKKAMELEVKSRYSSILLMLDAFNKVNFTSEQHTDKATAIPNETFKAEDVLNDVAWQNTQKSAAVVAAVKQSPAVSVPIPPPVPQQSALQAEKEQPVATPAPKAQVVAAPDVAALPNNAQQISGLPPQPIVQQEIQPAPIASTKQAGKKGTWQQPSTVNIVQPDNGNMQPQMQQLQPANALPKKSHHTTRWVVAIIAVVLLVAFIGYTAIQFLGAKSAIEAQEFIQAQKNFNNAPWLQVVFKNDYKYAEAMSEWERGNYRKCLRALDKLENSAQLIQVKKQVKYDWAMAYMEDGDIRNSLKLFKELNNYADSRENVQNLEIYLEAFTTEDVLQSFTLYAQLGDFLDSAQKVKKMQYTLLDEATNLYSNRHIADSQDMFAVVYEYGMLPSDEMETVGFYLQAVQAAEAIRQATSYAEAEPWLQKIKQLEDHILIDSVLLSDGVVSKFLNGYWETANGEVFMCSVDEKTINSDGLNVPEGAYALTGEGIISGESEEVYIYFFYIDYDTLEFWDLKNGGQYTFVRQ